MFMKIDINSREVASFLFHFGMYRIFARGLKRSNSSSVIGGVIGRSLFGLNLGTVLRDIILFQQS